MATINSYWFSLYGYPSDLDTHQGCGTSAVVTYEPDGAEGYDLVEVAQGPIEPEAYGPHEAGPF